MWDKLTGNDARSAAVSARKQGVPQFKFTPYLRWPPV
jgi:hypothetical protein